MGLPFDQVVRQQHFIQDHPEWSIHAQDGARRFIAEKGVTIHATLTDATPQAINDLLTDPRADHNTPLSSQPATTSQDHVGHLARHTGVAPRANTGRKLAAGTVDFPAPGVPDGDRYAVAGQPGHELLLRTRP